MSSFPEELEVSVSCWSRDVFGEDCSVCCVANDAAGASRSVPPRSLLMVILRQQQTGAPAYRCQVRVRAAILSRFVCFQEVFVRFRAEAPLGFSLSPPN